MATTSNSDRRLFKNLPPWPRKKILEYLQEPSLSKWFNIRYTPVTHGLTLYDIIDSLDRTWEGEYPSMILIARASRVVDRQNKDLELLEM